MNNNDRIYSNQEAFNLLCGNLLSEVGFGYCDTPAYKTPKFHSNILLPDRGLLH